MGVLHDAVHLEEKAERTYREAASRTRDPSARALLGLLAEAEAAHAAVLKTFGHVADLQGPDLIEAARAWVRGAVEGNAGVLSPDAQVVEVLRRAADAEREAEAFYRHHAERATEARTAELLAELAKIERGHCALVSSLVEYYNRPNEWTESAEFGLRPDY